MKKYEIELIKEKSKIVEENSNLKELDVFLSAHILLYRLWESEGYEYLPDLLSGMSPKPFGNIIAIDDAVAADWNEIIGDKEQLSAEDGYEAMLRFLEKETYWLKLDPVITKLKKDYENREGWWVKWLEIYNKVKEE